MRVKKRGFQFLFWGILAGVFFYFHQITFLPLREPILRDEFITRWALILLIAIGISISYKASHFNFGISGQMVLASFLSIAIVYINKSIFFLEKSLPFVIGILVFISLFSLGFLIGFLSFKTGINEFLTTWILSQALVPLLDGIVLTTHLYSGDSSRLNSFLLPFKIPPEFLISFSFFLWIIWVFIFYKTKWGLILKIWPKNQDFVLSLGFSAVPFFTFPLAFSFAFIGLAGFFLTSSLHDSYIVGMTQGWDLLGITVSLMVFHSPLGIFMSSLTFAYLGTLEDIWTLFLGSNIKWSLWIQIFVLIFFSFIQSIKEKRRQKNV